MTDKAQFLLDRVSLTGADNQASLPALSDLSEQYPFVEWALLYVPHNEGAPRNPTQVWRCAFFEAQLKGFSAVHLCGRLAFEQGLQGRLPSELLQTDRLQLNINARKREFTDAEVLEVYRRALDLGPALILQYHADSAAVINKFLSSLADCDQSRVHVLLDDSRGLGKQPAGWHLPINLEKVFCGFAGGLGPDNLASVIGQVQGYGNRYWLDMESGIRTDNQLDLAKVQRVLEVARTYRA